MIRLILAFFFSFETVILNKPFDNTLLRDIESCMARSLPEITRAKSTYVIGYNINLFQSEIVNGQVIQKSFFVPGHRNNFDFLKLHLSVSTQRSCTIGADLNFSL